MIKYYNNPIIVNWVTQIQHSYLPELQSLGNDGTSKRIAFKSSCTKDLYCSYLLTRNLISGTLLLKVNAMEKNFSSWRCSFQPYFFKAKPQRPHVSRCQIEYYNIVLEISLWMCICYHDVKSEQENYVWKYKKIQEKLSHIKIKKRDGKYSNV